MGQGFYSLLVVEEKSPYRVGRHVVYAKDRLKELELNFEF
jgi:hypothetical protein